MSQWCLILSLLPPHHLGIRCGTGCMDFKPRKVEWYGMLHWGTRGDASTGRIVQTLEQSSFCMCETHGVGGAVSRIALVKPEKARAVEDTVLRAVQSGQITEKVRNLQFRHSAILPFCLTNTRPYYNLPLLLTVALLHSD